MIDLKFEIENPFSERFEMLASTSKRLTRHKAVEASAYKTTNIITLSLSYCIRQDHAGLRIVLGLVGYECQLHIYDTRHWDDETNSWAKFNELID
jgi:hypothetical protein